MKRLRVLLIVFWITYAFAQLTCEEECEQGIEVKTKTLFCGTDGKEHLISYEHEMQRVARCYNEKCNITAFTPGHCECPTYCYQGLGKGLCYQGQCHCYKGWTGKDCSSMECPNTCSNHGKCVQGEKEGLIATYCHCEEGWTGDDCATPIDNFSRIPYGEFFGPEDSDEGFHHINKKDSGYWHKRDRYKDHHPLFHFEQIASINIQISEENFKNLLAPSNKWSQDFWNCSVFIDNAHKERNSQPTDQLGEDFSKHDRGHVTRVINNVGIRLKGTATREYLKKSFKLKFNTIPEDFMEHVLNKPDDNSPDRKRRFFELKKLGIKAPFHDDSFIKNQIMAEFYRAWEIPTARASFASLSINGLHWGLFWIHEAMDDVFISAHYEDYNGNYYKAGCGGSYLVYLGEDPERYKNASKEWRDTVRPFIYQKQGNGDWSDIVHMISVLYKTKSEDFAREIQKVMDVEKYLRYLVIETAVCNTDDYTRNGNNWKLYKNPETGLFEMHGFDWDITFRSTKCSIWGGDERAQLTHRILKIPEFRERYMRLMNLFINKIWTSKTLKDRITRWKDFILNEVRKDYNYRLDFSRSEMDMQKEIDYMLNFIPSRYENIKEQLKEAGFKDVDHAEADEKARHELHSALVLTILAGGGVCGLALIYLSHIVKNYTKVRAKAMLHGHHHRNQNDNNGYHTYHL